MSYATSPGINFRSSASPNADNGTYDVSCLAVDSYPASGKSVGGIYPFGWVGASITFNDGGVSARHSYGNHNYTGGSQMERVGSLITGHTYRLRGLFGFIGFSANIGFTLAKDNAFTQINSGVNADITAASVAGSSCIDIRGNVYTSYALWEAAQDTASCYTDYVCSGTTDLYILRSNTNFAGPSINWLGIEDLSAVAADPHSRTLLRVGT